MGALKPTASARVRGAISRQPQSRRVNSNSETYAEVHRASGAPPDTKRERGNPRRHVPLDDRRMDYGISTPGFTHGRKAATKRKRIYK
ncbi:MAG: hypothetical protein ACXWP5_06400 [Bdellovibrionota bacterium]